jgi:metallo-beta-lactamase family protein
VKLQFLGATQTVTGSKYLLTVENKRILVDCGLFQGLKELRLRNWEPFPLAPSSIDAVIMTHAHIDHSGYIPLLVRDGFKGKIYCTEGTRDLCEILLPDCGFLQEEETRRANKYGYTKHKPALPLYTMEDAKKSLNQFVPCDFSKKNKIFDNFNFSFHGAGHILGASTVLFEQSGKTILFSGDLGRYSDSVMYDPESIDRADYLVVESTYGDRLHEKIDPKDQLGQIINQTVKRGGTIVIPAFAVGRTQNILYYIYQLKKAREISDIPVYLDSPLATTATDIFLRHPEDHHLTKEECVGLGKVAECAETVEQSKLIDAIEKPKIIISASGMATGGRVLHHLRAFAPDSRNTILFAGYQAAGTRGDTMIKGISEVKMLGEIVKINAEVIVLSNISAHADYEETLRWLSKLKKAPKKTFITHGEIHAAKALKEKIEEQFHWNCDVPKYLQEEILK